MLVLPGRYRSEICQFTEELRPFNACTMCLVPGATETGFACRAGATPDSDQIADITPRRRKLAIREFAIGRLGIGRSF